MALSTIIGGQLSNVLYLNGNAGPVIQMALMTSAYVPNYATGIYSTTDEVVGTGYTAGGVLVASALTETGTPASAWTNVWAASTPYLVNQIVVPSTTNGYVYRCLVGGTSSATAPTFPTTIGTIFTDGGVTWVNAGTMVSVTSSGPFNWPSSTITASWGIMYANSANAGIGLEYGIGLFIDFGGSVSSIGSNFVVSPDPLYGWFYSTQA